MPINWRHVLRRLRACASRTLPWQPTEGPHSSMIHAGGSASRRICWNAGRRPIRCSHARRPASDRIQVRLADPSPDF